MVENNQTERNGIPDDTPPVLSSWNWLYFLEAANLIALIVLFYIFTRTFR